MELLDLLKSRDIRATKEIELKGELAGCKITIRPVTTEEWQSARARSIKISKTGEPSVDQVAMGISLMVDVRTIWGRLARFIPDNIKSQHLVDIN